MKIPPIKPAAFNRSIELALQAPPDAGTSIERIEEELKTLPKGKLYSSDQGTNVSFYVMLDGHQKYLAKKSRKIYGLARKKYLLVLLEILTLTGSHRAKEVERRKVLIGRLQNMINLFAKGNLDIGKIVMTPKQFAWFRGNFHQKYINEEQSVVTASGIPVRSKSERDIVNSSEELAVPFHYEEETIVFVGQLVHKLEKTLRSKYGIRGEICTRFNGMTHWTVPPELEWMNAPGSVWTTYDPVSGKIRMHSDFRIMLADGRMIVWEHEGLIDQFMYRRNALERVSLIKLLDDKGEYDLIETYEQDIDTPDKRMDLIRREVLPRLWF